MSNDLWASLTKVGKRLGAAVAQELTKEGPNILLGLMELAASPDRLPGSSKTYEDRKNERPTPWAVLGVTPNASLAVCNAVYRERAKTEHPDVGGDAEAWKTVSAALEQIKTYRYGRGD